MSPRLCVCRGREFDLCGCLCILHHVFECAFMCIVGVGHLSETAGLSSCSPLGWHPTKCLEPSRLLVHIAEMDEY